MKKLVAGAALASAMASAVAVGVPAHAGMATRTAVMATRESVAGYAVQYNAAATYLGTSPGTATITCNAVSLGLGQNPRSQCWLEDLDNGERFDAFELPHLQASYNVQAIVVNGASRRLTLCMYVDFEFGDGPTVCTQLT